MESKRATSLPKSISRSQDILTTKNQVWSVHHCCSAWPSNSPSPKRTILHPCGQALAIVFTKEMCISSGKCPFSSGLTIQTNGTALPLYSTESISIVLEVPVWLLSIMNTISPREPMRCSKCFTNGWKGRPSPSICWITNAWPVEEDSTFSLSDNPLKARSSFPADNVRYGYIPN
jgi:hypothetical protein